jgi:hypothetical protein
LRPTLECVVAGIAVLAVGNSGVGYATAWRALDRCAEPTLREARHRGLAGYHMTSARVEPARDMLDARLSGPFRVEVRFNLPADLHATGYSKRLMSTPG